MVKKAKKYLLIASVNVLILTLMLAFWTDKVERILNDNVRFYGFLEIFIFTCLSLVIIRFSVQILRYTKNESKKTRIIASILLTVIVCSHLYINYSKKIVNNQFINQTERNKLSKKLKPQDGFLCGSSGSRLTNAEYKIITKNTWFPELQDDAINISYSYVYESFFPDYGFGLEFDLPKSITLDTIEFKYGEFKVDTLQDFIHITYDEHVI